MMPILAQITPEMMKDAPLTLVVIGALLFLFNQGKEAFARKSPKPANEEIGIRVMELERKVEKIETTFAEHAKGVEIHISTRSKGIYDKIDSMRMEIEKKMDANAVAAESSRHQMNERIDPVISNTAEIKGKMDAFTQSFQSFAQIITAIAHDKDK